MATSTGIALVAALLMVGGLLLGLFVLNLLIGGTEFFFGKPKLKILKSQMGSNGFAFAFDWNSAKEPGAMDHVKVRMFNAFGNPSQVEVSRKFDKEKDAFAIDVDLGISFQKMITSDNFKNSKIQIEISSSTDGLVFQFEMKGSKFLLETKDASKTVEEYLNLDDEAKELKFGVQVERNTTADTVPGKGTYLKIATNPVFADAFAGSLPGSKSTGGAAGDDAGGGEEQFTVAKVWIAEGCIVCDACEAIYPEVFDVQSDTCLIRPDAGPGSELLKNGLLIEEAAEACPVEVIKYDKA